MSKSKIKEIRELNCKETWSRWPEQFDFVHLFIAEMIDGTRFYTAKGGTEVFGTEADIDGYTDIADIHDFQSISVPGGVNNVEQFRKIVESEAVIDQLC